MLLFGHIGYTLAAGLLLNNSLHINRIISKETDEKSVNPKAIDLKGPSAKFWKLIQQTKGLDLRWVIIGSLLPDIIDKPIGHIIFKDTFGTGQIYCHTLLFAIFLFLAGYVASSIYKKNFILLIAFGNLMHLILDFMWRKPSILLWPIYGFTFEKSTPIPFGEYLWNILRRTFQTPWAIIPEVVAAIITIWFIWVLIREKKFGSFIVKGSI